MAQAIESDFDEILEANTLDLEASREMAVPELILDWLKLTPSRLENTIKILQRLGELSDPLRRVRTADYQQEDSQSYTQLMPLGVIPCFTFPPPLTEPPFFLPMIGDPTGAFAGFPCFPNICFSLLCWYLTSNSR
jgi:hypothetical protein